ncbi:hypothetical protein ACFLRF_00310 [Candidatus Altiarchaeota archaeon]
MKEEIILFALISVLTLFIGLLVGGGFTYWYMPRTCSKVIQTTSVEYQCYDGSKKESIDSCAKPNIPECKDSSSSSTKTTDDSGKTIVTIPFNCGDCMSRCPQIQSLCGQTGGVTTTTIHIPVLPPCASDLECGEPKMSEIKCRYGKMERIKEEPFCDDGFCKTRQSRQTIRSCMDNERCVTGTGCIPRDDYDDE